MADAVMSTFNTTGNKKVSFLGTEMVESRALVARTQIVCEQSILLSLDLRRSWYSPGGDVSCV